LKKKKRNIPGLFGSKFLLRFLSLALRAARVGELLLPDRRPVHRPAQRLGLAVVDHGVVHLTGFVVGRPATLRGAGNPGTRGASAERRAAAHLGGNSPRGVDPARRGLDLGGAGVDEGVVELGGVVAAHGGRAVGEIEVEVGEVEGGLGQPRGLDLLLGPTGSAVRTERVDVVLGGVRGLHLRQAVAGHGGSPVVMVVSPEAVTVFPRVPAVVVVFVVAGRQRRGRPGGHAAHTGSDVA